MSRKSWPKGLASMIAGRATLVAGVNASQRRSRRRGYVRSKLLLAVREQPDTGVMAGKGRFIKALAGGADVRGPLKTTANVG
jgi:hypothetical protein